MDGTLGTIVSIVAALSVMINFGLMISKVLGKEKWENIFKVMAQGIDTAKKFIPADQKIQINGKSYFPHTAEIKLNSEDSGIDRDIKELLDKHGLNKTEE